jgi:hypothetical protein
VWTRRSCSAESGSSVVFTLRMSNTGAPVEPTDGDYIVS